MGNKIQYEFNNTLTEQLEVLFVSCRKVLSTEAAKKII